MSKISGQFNFQDNFRTVGIPAYHIPNCYDVEV